MHDISSVTFEHDAPNRLFVLETPQGQATVNYVMKNHTMMLTHSEVPQQLRGKGIGKTLVENTFSYLIQHKIKAVAVCSYIKRVRDRDSKWHNWIQ